MPDWRKQIRSVIAVLNLEATREAEVVEELSQHLRDRRDEMLASGMSAEQADEALIQELHDVTLIAGLKATIRCEESPLPVGRDGSEQLLARIWVDLRYGARLLLQNPGFAIVVILSLALGIGANTAIFQLLNAVRLRTLPVAKPERLAAVRIVNSPHCCRGNFYSDHADLTGGLWNQLRQQQQGFSEIAAWFPRRQNLGQGGEARHVDTVMVSGNFFKVLGVQPSLGRLISPLDDYRGCGAQGAVVSYGFWQQEFGGSREVLERKIMLNGHPFQIMGVTPPNFYGVEVGRNFDVAIPLCAEAFFSTKDPLMDSPVSWWITTIGRLKPGWTLERASAQLAVISPGIFAATVPAEFDNEARKDYLSFRLGAVPAASGFSKLRSDYQEPLWVLLALSGLVLLIACAESRESHAGAGQRPGDGIAINPWCVTLAADSATADGEFTAGGFGSSRRGRTGADFEQGTGNIFEHAAGPHLSGTDAGLAGTRLRDGVGRFCLYPIWVDSGDEGFPYRTRCGVKGERARTFGCGGKPFTPARAGGLAGRAFAGAPYGCALVRAYFSKPHGGECGISGRSRPPCVL